MRNVTKIYRFIDLKSPKKAEFREIFVLFSSLNSHFCGKNHENHYCAEFLDFSKYHRIYPIFQFHHKNSYFPGKSRKSYVGWISGYFIKILVMINFFVIFTVKIKIRKFLGIHPINDTLGIQRGIFRTCFDRTFNNLKVIQFRYLWILR